MITFQELKEKLVEQHDEVALCELLEVTREDLVNAFEDRIEARFSQLVREIE